MAERLFVPLLQGKTVQDLAAKQNSINQKICRMLRDIATGPNIPNSRLKVASITADKYYELRNTYVMGDQDSLDATYPFEMDFEIVSEMTTIQSVKLSFRIREFRAYAKGVPSGGGHTTPSGGGHTTPSGGGHTTPSGGGATSGATGSASGGGATSGATGSASGGGHTSGAGGEQTSSAGGGETSSATSLVDHNHYFYDYTTETDTSDGHTHLYYRISGVGGILTSPTHTHTVSNHTHTVSDHTHAVSDHTHPNHTHTTPNHTHPNHTHTTPAHTHTVSDHQHTVSAHTHTVSNHTHSLTFGIYEDSQSPTIHYHIDNGAGYGGASGNYNSDQLDINITGSISGTGFKRIKFDSNVRCRISSWVLIKLDLTA